MKHLPRMLGTTQAFAKKSVTNAMNQLSADIEKVNRSIDQAKQNELNKTVTPAINALIQKSNARLSQAENALLSLGYRLDQHGNPINILEERKEAIKSAVLHVLTTCTSDESFPEELLKKGIRLKLSKEDREVEDKKIYRVPRYEDGKGKSISARELGPEFMASSVSKKINENAQVEQDRQAIVKSKMAYETAMANSFVHHKGSATEFSKYLKGLQSDDIEEISKRIGQEQGKIGVEYIRHRLQADIDKSEIQLAGERDKLRSQGLDVGQRKGNNMKGMRHN